jgi:uncharacterized membrane protein YgcG
MVNKAGETLLPMVTPDRGTIAGAIWKSEASGGASVVVYLDANGLPTKTIFGDFILLFSNWNIAARTVDIAEIYGPNGYIQVFKGASIPLNVTLPSASTGSAMVAKSTCFPACDSDAKNLAELLKFAGLGLSVGACGVATTVSLGAMALPCAGVIVTTAIAVVDNETWLNNLGDVGDILSKIDYFQCALGDAGACLSSALDVGSNVLSDASAIDTTYAPLDSIADNALVDPAQVSGVVEPGSGLPTVPSGAYECTPGGSMSFEPCLSGGVRTCQPDYTWSACPDNPTGDVVDTDGGDTGGGGTGGGGTGGGGTSGGSCTYNYNVPAVKCPGETCVTFAACCTQCSISSCVSTSDEHCNGASYYYKVSGDPTHYSTASACQLAANCMQECFGVTASCQ